MAEGVCEVARNRNKKIRLMSENGEFMSANRDKKASKDGLNLKSIFYLDNLDNNCFTQYSVNNVDGVNRASGFCPHVDGFPPEYKGICPNNDENCRKKRCSDRYDSSESSDSGITVSSSASSGTSDITDPGSPFSTSSEDSSSSPGKCKEEKRCKSEEKSPDWLQPIGRCRSEEKTWTQSWESKQQQQQQPNKTDHNFITPETDFKMAPNVPSASSPCGIWTSITENNTANETAHFNKFNKSEAININNKNNNNNNRIVNNNNNSNINNNNKNNNNNNNNSTSNSNNSNTKRLKTDGADMLTVSDYILNVPSLVDGEIDGCADRRVGSSVDLADTGKMSIRRTSCENAKSNRAGVKTCEKTAGSVAKPKQDRNRHQGKITEYFKSQVKSLAGVKREYGHNKKDTTAAKRADGCGKNQKPDECVTAAAKKPRTETDSSDKAVPEVPIFVKPSTKLLQTAMPLAGKLLLSKIPNVPDFLSNKPPETKTLFNKILQNHKIRKLAEMKSKTPTGVPTAKEGDVRCMKTHDSPARSDSPTVGIANKLEESNAKPEQSANEAEGKEKETNSEAGNRWEVTPDLGGLPESNQSPILSAPTTIRFPVSCDSGSSNLLDKHLVSRSPSVVCRWESCAVECASGTGLLEHLQTAHVLTQVSGEKFVCLWVGCKVFDQKSCSRSWLERHVLSHAGNKPYRCIVDGCGQGFSTQTILERHVNSHFQADVKKALDNPLAHKLFRRNGKKLRYRRQPWSARMFDFFDSGVMEALEYRLVKLTQTRTGGDVTDTPGKSLVLTSQVVARRMTANGRQQFLLRWYPSNIVEDEWVYEKDIVQKKTVSIPSLSPSVSTSLQETLALVMRPPGSCRISRRKNKSNYQSNRGEAECREAEQELPVPELEQQEQQHQKKRKEYETEAIAGKLEEDLGPEFKAKEENDLRKDASREPHLPPPPKVPDKHAGKPKVKKRRNCSRRTESVSVLPAAAVSVPVMDSNAVKGNPGTGPVVSLKPKEEEPIASGATAAAAATAAALPEEVPLVPVCPPTEDIIPVQTGGIIVESTKLIAPVKTDMILSSPVKLVTSQYIEQPYVQTVMPVQMPVAYQIPIVKLSPPSGLFLPHMPNYIIPPSPPAVFPAPPVSTFRNGFQLSATGTIQIQTSSTTLQQTGSNFMQSTNASGFQIVQSPVAIPQSILTAFQNSGIANMGLKSPTLRLLNCQPLILNKPMTNVSMTVTNVTTTRAEQNPTMSAVSLPVEATKTSRKIPTPNKKVVKQKLTILPKPNITAKSNAPDASKSKKQCLQHCAPATRAVT